MKRAGVLLLAAVPVIATGVYFVMPTDSADAPQAAPPSVTAQSAREDAKDRAEQEHEREREKDDSVVADMPPGHSLVSTTMLPAASRVPGHHPSSMLTYWYPASFRPHDTSASVCALMTLALMFAAKLFHDALPIGGAATTAAALAAAAAVDVAGTVRATATVHVPSVFPGVHLFDPVRRSATMPKEDATP